MDIIGAASSEIDIDYCGDNQRRDPSEVTNTSYSEYRFQSTLAAQQLQQQHGKGVCPIGCYTDVVVWRQTVRFSWSISVRLTLFWILQAFFYVSPQYLCLQFLFYYYYYYYYYYCGKYIKAKRVKKVNVGVLLSRYSYRLANQWLKCKIRGGGTLHSVLGPSQWSCAISWHYNNLRWGNALKHNLEVGEWRSLASHYTLTTAGRLLRKTKRN